MGAVGLEIITGRMGMGKSLMLSKIIRDALDDRAQVHTNLGLNWVTINSLDKIRPLVCLDSEWPKCFYRDNIVVLPRDVKQMRDCIRAGHEDSPNVLVLDEAALYFSVDDQNVQDEKKNNREVFNFLVWSRRYGLEVYFATQSEKNINVKLRRMAQYRTDCFNYAKLPYFGWFFNFRLPFIIGFLQPLLFWTCQFTRTKYVLEDEKDVKLFTSRSWFEKKYGDFYYTHDLMDSGIVLNVHNTRKRVRQTDQTIGKFIVFGLLSTILICGYWGYKQALWMIYPPPMKKVSSGAAGKVAEVVENERYVYYQPSPSVKVVSKKGQVFTVDRETSFGMVTKIVKLPSQVIVEFKKQPALHLYK